MRNEKGSEVVTKQKYPEFFETLEDSLAGLKLPEITIGESRICSNAKASHISYSIFFNRIFWDKLNNQERVAAALHEIGHLKSPVRRFYVYPILIVSLAVIPYFVFYLYLRLFTLVFYFWILWVIYVRFFVFGVLCYVSRWDENFADNFASQRIDKKYLVSAIKKLPRGKPLYRLIYYLSLWPFETHPSPKKRIAHILKKN